MMPVSADSILGFLLDELSAITGRHRSTFSAETTLLGSNGALASRELVQLLLAVEEFADQTMSVRFDWTSDSAMSEARSLFRTVGTLTEHLDGLQRAPACSQPQR